jgi:hypothetical protein
MEAKYPLVISSTRHLMYEYYVSLSESVQLRWPTLSSLGKNLASSVA